MKLKTLSAACLAGALLCPSLTAYAGIPVMVDADPLRQIQYATDAQNWLKTVEQYKSQLNAYKSQLATATGVRNVQDFLSQAKGLSNDLKNLQKNGISLNDLLTNYERVSDHCSNIAGCLLDMKNERIDLHKYLGDVKSGSNEFLMQYNTFEEKYKLA